MPVLEASPLVTVVILAYNREQELRVTLTALRDELEYPAEQLEVIVVDNASQDGTAAMVREEFPAVELIVNPANVGGGWAWYELESIDGSVGATHAELDALRLAAIVLAHWDNKAANQRLVCLSQDDVTTPCSQPCWNWADCFSWTYHIYEHSRPAASCST